MARSGAGTPPNGGNLWKQVTGTDKRRFNAWNNTGRTSMSQTDFAAATHTGPVGSLFDAVPTAADTALYGKKASTYEMVGYFGTDFDDADAESMQHYAWDNRGYYYEPDGSEPVDFVTGEEPAPITLAPTSTINPDRPRTVAAGYDFSERKLTVIFRDGTYYNYFDVDNRTWQNFVRARSKGRYILAHLDAHPRGTADVAAIPEFAREAAYRFIRTGQNFRAGYNVGQKVGSKRGSGYGKGNLGGTGRKRLAASRGQTGGSGVTMPKKP